MADFNAYRIGGKAKYLAQAFDADGLRRALELHPNRLIIGRGSKLLVSDGGFDGVVILMRNSECGTTAGFTRKRDLRGSGGFPALS